MPLIKKGLLLLLLVPQVLFAQKMEKYCEVVAMQFPNQKLSTSVNISVDYGGNTPRFFKDRRSADKDAFVDVMKFNTVADAMNYLGTKGWKLVSSFAVNPGTAGVKKEMHYYFRKEYDASELAAYKP